MLGIRCIREVEVVFRGFVGQLVSLRCLGLLHIIEGVVDEALIATAPLTLPLNNKQPFGIRGVGKQGVAVCVVQCELRTRQAVSIAVLLHLVEDVGPVSGDAGAGFGIPPRHIKFAFIAAAGNSRQGCLVVYTIIDA